MIVRAANEDCKDLALDFYGNYTLQDLIGLTARWREVARKLLQLKKITQSKYDEAMGLVRHKRDYLRESLRPSMTI